MVVRRKNASRRTVRATRNTRSMSRPSVGFLSPYGFGHAFGMISIIALIFYAIMTWFSTYNPSIVLQQYPIEFSFNDWTIIIGVIQTYVLSYIGGWIFARIYNKTVARYH